MSSLTLKSAKILQAEPTANLKPKEHGAYAILVIPVMTAIFVTGPTLVGLCIAVASIAGFLAHEPLLVALGHRGARAQRTTPAAQRRLGVMLTVTIAFGVVSMAVGAKSVRYSLLACAALAIASFAIAFAGKHRTLGGQLWGVVGLSVPCVPILLAGDFPTLLSMEAWGTWLIGFGATTLAVRGVIATQKRQSKAVHWAAISVLSAAFSALTFAGFILPIVTLPMIAMSWYLMFIPPHASQLKRIGWTLVAGTIMSAVWMAINVKRNQDDWIEKSFRPSMAVFCNLL